jgi:hypothetical protein
MNQEATLRASIKNLVAALKSGDNINIKRNAFINAGKAYVKANATPVEETAPLTRGTRVAVKTLMTASGVAKMKGPVLSALNSIKRLLSRARPATSTPVNNTRITNLIGADWNTANNKNNRVTAYLAGKSARTTQKDNRAIGNKNFMGRYKDPKLRAFWGMVDAKMKAKARENAAAKAQTNAAAKTQANAAAKTQANAAAREIRVGIMGANKFNTIANQNAAITKYIDNKTRNKVANRKALAGRFGFRTVDPNLIRFFAAVNAKTAAQAAAEKARAAEAKAEAKAKAAANAKAAAEKAAAEKAAAAKAAPTP